MENSTVKQYQEMETLKTRQSAMFIARDLKNYGNTEDLIELAEKIYQFMIKK